MTGQPALCPVCGCPIQKLIVPGTSWGETQGTLQDALDAHSAVVHPNERPQL